MSQVKTINLKIFLLDFADVRAEPGYDADFVNRLFFGTEAPVNGPDPDNAPISASVFQFFFGVSDGWLRVRGEVVDWKTSSLNARDLPHWNGDTMQAPEDDGPMVYYGASLPVVVAETLRENKLTTADIRSAFPQWGSSIIADSGYAPLVVNKVLEMSDGKRADKLVFLHTDVDGGGAKRTLGEIRTTITRMSHDKVRTRLMPNSRSTWDSLWDEAWLGLPEIAVVPLLVPATPAAKRADGTYPAFSGDLRMFAYEVLLHELGHLLLGLGDMYGGTFASWDENELMHGIRSHVPQTFGSYTRAKLGWLKFIEKSREDHGFVLRPFETHNAAVRFTNGAPGSNHYLVMTNREELRVSGADWSDPPARHGQGIFTYRLDTLQRQRVSWGGEPVRKVTSVVRLDGDGGESWKPGEVISSMPPANEIQVHPATLRNPAGELWWTLDAITDEGAGDLGVDMKLQALHLVGDYHRAAWESGSNGTTPLTLDSFQGKDGHVMMVDRTMAVAGQQRGRALYIHPSWTPGGRIKATYDITSLNNAPFRLYAKIAMPDSATGSDGVTVSFRAGRSFRKVQLLPGQYQEIIHDFRSNEAALELQVSAGQSATRDWVYLLDGWLVPLAPESFDFVRNASSATWRTARGELPFNAGSSSAGEASVSTQKALLDGVPWGPKVLFTHPNWANDGYIEGVWNGVAVPPTGAFIRAAVGFADGRHNPDTGVDISVSLTNSLGSEEMLINRAGLLQYDSNARRDWEQNLPMLLELPVPKSLWGQPVDLKVRVDARDNSGQDWVCWPYLRMTEA